MTEDNSTSMETKAELLAFLSTIPRQMLKRALKEDERQRRHVTASSQQMPAPGPNHVVNSGNYTLPSFPVPDPATGHAHHIPNLLNVAPPTPQDVILAQQQATQGKPLRPLNAFMAFRSWYSRICPDAQQKDISALITKLWEKDGFRNSWSLVAKLYSSIRDIVGKGQISLKEFLTFACPVMNLASPSEYLNIYHWQIEVNADGGRVLAQDEQGASQVIAIRLQKLVPNTEIDLLDEIIKTGFMPAYAHELKTQLTARNMGVMTVHGRNKLEQFANALAVNPSQVASSMLGADFGPIDSVNITQVGNFDEVEEEFVLYPTAFTHYTNPQTAPFVPYIQEQNVPAMEHTITNAIDSQSIQAIQPALTNTHDAQNDASTQFDNSPDSAIMENGADATSSPVNGSFAVYDLATFQQMSAFSPVAPATNGFDGYDMNNHALSFNTEPLTEEQAIDQQTGKLLDEKQELQYSI